MPYLAEQGVKSICRSYAARRNLPRLSKVSFQLLSASVALQSSLELRQAAQELASVKIMLPAP